MYTNQFAKPSPHLHLQNLSTASTCIKVHAYLAKPDPGKGPYIFATPFCMAPLSCCGPDMARLSTGRSVVPIAYSGSGAEDSGRGMVITTPTRTRALWCWVPVEGVRMDVSGFTCGGGGRMLAESG